MNELEAKKSFSNYLQENTIPFSTGKQHPHSKPDFVFQKDNIWCCAGVKGNDSDPLLAIGEMVNYFSDFSHVYICAPPLFLYRFLETVETNPELTHFRRKIGVILLGEGKTSLFQEPINQIYYFRETVDYKRNTKKKPNLLDVIDQKILNFAEEGPVFSPDAQKFGFKKQKFYQKLLKLERQGYLRRAILKANPIPFVRTEKNTLT